MTSQPPAAVAAAGTPTAAVRGVDVWAAVAEQAASLNKVLHFLQIFRILLPLDLAERLHI